MVGLAPDVPLSRRVQLAVLAHIRHVHTRYDLLLREVGYFTARKVVEPVCLDVLVKWRGDEETGRDQMEEILREVVVITDSEEEDDSSGEEGDEEDDDEEGSSEEEGEVTSASSASVSLPNSRNERRSAQPQSQVSAASARARAAPKDKKSHRGFQRYQDAWDKAKARQQDNVTVPEAGHIGTPAVSAAPRLSRAAMASPYTNGIARPNPPPFNTPYDALQSYTRAYADPRNIAPQVSYSLGVLFHVGDCIPTGSTDNRRILITFSSDPLQQVGVEG